MKILKILITIILSIVLIALVGCGILLYQLSDNTNDSTIDVTNTPIDVDEEIASIISKSFKNIETNEIVDLALTENDLNLICAGILTKLKQDETIANTINIKSIYIDITEGKYLTLHIPAEKFRYNTHVAITLAPSQNDTEINVKVEGVRLGKMNFGVGIAKTVNGLYNFDKMVNDAFKESNLPITFDVNTLTITLKKDDIKTFVNSLLKENPILHLAEAITNLFLRKDDLLNLILCDENKFGVTLNTSELSYLPSVIGEIPYNNDYSSVISNVVYLLNNKVIDYKVTTPVFSFLVMGYEKLSEEQKLIIDPLDLTSIGITDNSDYEGILTKYDLKIENILASQVPSPTDLLKGEFGMKINESEINKILYDLNLIGTSFAFPRVENDSYKVSYIVIDSLFLDISDDSFKVIMTVDLNGKKVSVNLDCSSEQSNALSIEATIDTIYYGTIAATSEEKTSLLTYLESVLTTLDWIKVNKTTGTITFDFIDLITDNNLFKSLLLATNNYYTKFKYDENDSYILIYFSLK